MLQEDNFLSERFMSIFLKWLIRALISFCLLVLVVSIVTYSLASRSLPNYNQTLDSDKIDSKIEIIRDSSNIPHIFSRNINDVFFGLGYAHAQDRFWQLNILRRSAQGRLSEIFGQKTLQLDEFVRRLDIYNLSRLSLNHQSEMLMKFLRIERPNQHV